MDLFTIGHSTHPLNEFLGLLQQHQIAALVDIRRFPSSRNCPQFNRDKLEPSLWEKEIEYHWLEALGGRRPKQKEFISPNDGLRNQSFRNYADYMRSAEFQRGMDRLQEIAAAKRTAIMCAENVFWRCHRRLVSDYVLAAGGSVQHIFPGGELKPHALTEGAVAKDGRVTYPSPKTLFD